MLKRAHVRQFLTLVDTGSFTKAAHRLRVTQPTLSAGIADLERIVDARLFERQRGGARLTERGAEFLVIARDLENRFREADAFGRKAPQDRPLLRIGTIRTVTDATLRSLIEACATSFDVQLTEGVDYDLRAALIEGRLDAALTVLRPHETSDDVWPAFEEPYLVFAPIDHPLAGRTGVAPAELAGETMIARRTCEALTETSRFFTRHGVRPHFSFKSDNDKRCLEMAAVGLGITTAPQSLAVAGLLPIGVEGYELRRRVGVLIHKQAAGRDQLLQILSGLWPCV